MSLQLGEVIPSDMRVGACEVCDVKDFKFNLYNVTSDEGTLVYQKEPDPREVEISRLHIMFMKTDDKKIPIWALLLDAIDRATISDPSILLDADASGNQLFDCTRDELKPLCRLGSLIARIWGRPVRARRIPAWPRPKEYHYVGHRGRSKDNGRELTPEVVEFAKQAAVIWDVEGNIKIDIQMNEDGDFRYKNSDPSDRSTKNAGQLKIIEQVFLYID
ncbi:hypothetical protein QFC22_006735 [Naganishia vaughanmartiniae]|uniref:Uncharacterized protein n=1 Tax=Naganishia vaughanmartiniae TaxID=1424756 RepID=A0ACC2WG60_9TREE|nr:hypothetical protein QFC22_006735 [Naganishia vaughanmartiniae]